MYFIRSYNLHDKRKIPTYYKKMSIRTKIVKNRLNSKLVLRTYSVFIYLSFPKIACFNRDT